jgi:hypothetical protein
MPLSLLSTMARRRVFLICTLFSILPNELHAQGGHAIHPRDAKPHRRKNMTGHLGEALAHNGVQTWRGFKDLIYSPKLRSSQRRNRHNLRGLQSSYGVKGRGANMDNGNVFIRADTNRKPKGVNTSNQRKEGKVNPIFLVHGQNNMFQLPQGTQIIVTLTSLVVRLLERKRYRAI